MPAGQPIKVMRKASNRNKCHGCHVLTLPKAASSPAGSFPYAPTVHSSSPAFWVPLFTVLPAPPGANTPPGLALGRAAERREWHTGLVTVRATTLSHLLGIRHGIGRCTWILYPDYNCLTMWVLYMGHCIIGENKIWKSKVLCPPHTTS